jgi:hypothetical protein
MTTDSRLLSIHVLGGGFGESIVLCLPNGKVGVIDCFSASLKAPDSEARLNANPTLRFLKECTRASRLAFVALTHPHEDRGRGLSHILEEYRDRIDEIWIFDAFQDIALERYFSALNSGKRKLPIEEIQGDAPGTFSAELLRIRNLVMKQIRKSNPSRAVPRVFCGPQLIQIEDEPVTIRFLGPTVAVAQEYRAQLVDNVSTIFDAGGRVNRRWEPEAVNHNVASPAFLVQFGDCRLVLGGDMESESWADVSADFAMTTHELSCRFVKVSHHGSVTGYTGGLYEQFRRSGAPIAVITPFNRHKSPLPQNEGVDYLKSQTAELWTTSVADAKRALGIEDPLTIDELMRARDA